MAPDKELDLRSGGVPEAPPAPALSLSKEDQAQRGLDILDGLEDIKKVPKAQKEINKAAGKHRPSENGGIKKDGELDKRVHGKGQHLFRTGDPRTRQMAQKGGRAGKVPKFREILERKLEEEAENFIRPYTEAMALREDDSWSPSTKLRFFAQQTEIAEKAFDRLEGKPVQRNRNVDKDDNDLTAESIGIVNKEAAMEVLMNMFAGMDQQAEEIEGTVLSTEVEDIS